MFINPLGCLTQSQAPFLTMYGKERLELGGKVVVNWLNKLVNYYLDELSMESGQTVLLDLPLHWRTILWLQAGWLAGLNMRVSDCGVEEEDLESVDFWSNHSEIATIVTTSPDKYQAAFLVGCEVVGLELASLSLRYRGDLPDFAIDGNATVLAQPDALICEATLPCQTVKTGEDGGLQVVELTVDSKVAAHASAISFPNGDFSRFSNRRVLLDLVNQEWGTEELSLILLRLWQQGFSVVLINTVNEVEELLKAEKVNLCLQKTQA